MSQVANARQRREATASDGVATTTKQGEHISLRRITRITIATAVGVVLAAAAPDGGNVLAGEIAAQQAQTTGKSKIIKRQPGLRKKLKRSVVRLNCIFGFERVATGIRGSYKCKKGPGVMVCAHPQYQPSQSASDFDVDTIGTKHGLKPAFRYICQNKFPNDSATGPVCIHGFRGTAKKPIHPTIQNYRCYSFSPSCATGYKVVSGHTGWSGQAARYYVAASYRCSK